MAVKRITNNIAPSITRLQSELDKIPSQAYPYFKKTTPIKTGNARRNTNLKGNTISGDYDYVNKLNDGYSKQAPGGMTDPTISEIRRLVRKVLK